jgi:hypothetical protein
VSLKDSKIATANSVDSDAYVDGSIDAVHLSANSVDSDAYVDGSIDEVHMSANSIDSDSYVDASIDNAHLADNAVDTAEIADNAVTLAKMDGLARGTLIYGDASGDPAALAAGGADEVLTHDGTDLAWAAASSFDADGAQVFNESGNDVDFRVEGNTNANLLFVNAGANEVHIGKSTNDFASSGINLQAVGEIWITRDASIPLSLGRLTSDGETIRFHNTEATPIGNVTTSSSSTAYNTSSDYRLKENETAITDGIDRVKQLKPYRFNFKTDTDKTLDGFFAHEVSSIVPEAISGEKDATETYTDENGDEQTRILPQGIDQAKLVPLLTSALQEAITKIETLEAKVTALENA